MRLFSFPYKRFGNRILPIIPVKIKNGIKSILTEAYMDSGASVSIFNVEIAEVLGIDYTKGKVIYPLGTAGHINSHLTEAILEINGIEI